MATHSLDEFTDFTGRCVVVTGAAGLIGAAICHRYAEAGATVFIHYRSDEVTALRLQVEIEAAGGQAHPVYADVTKKADVANMFAEIGRHCRRVDVLVNNAGIYPMSSIAEMPEEQWDSVVNASLRSTFLCTQAVIPFMEGGGSIINISSIEADSPTPQHSHYCAAKSAVIMFTRTSANELGSHKIRCNAVLPGLIRRENIEADWPEGVARWKEAAPLGCLGEGMDVANACLFLSSDAARWISGASLAVDGGVLSSSNF